MPLKINTSYGLLLFLILFMTPLAGIGIDLYTPSLPAITTHFQTSETLVKLTIAFIYWDIAFCHRLFNANFAQSHRQRDTAQTKK